MTPEQARDAHSHIDQFDRDILRYMLLWAPYGVLYDEDLYPQFGMNAHQFRHRFDDLVALYDLAAFDSECRNVFEGVRRYLATRAQEDTTNAPPADSMERANASPPRRHRRRVGGMKSRSRMTDGTVAEISNAQGPAEMSSVTVNNP